MPAKRVKALVGIPGQRRHRHHRSKRGASSLEKGHWPKKKAIEKFKVDEMDKDMKQVHNLIA